MRVLFTSVPAPSHVDPLLHLATAFDAAGHDVTMATGPALTDRIERAGIRAVAAGLDWTEPEADRTFPELRDLPLREMERWWVVNIFFDRHAKPMADDVGALLDDEPVDLLVRMYVEFGGWAAAKARGVPQAVFQLGKAWTPEQLPLVTDLLRPVVDHVVRGHEVSPADVYGDVKLLLHPPSYDGWTPPVPWLRARPPVWFPDGSRPARPDVLADAPPDRPVVLVTFGTVFNRTPGAFEVVLEALADLPVTAVVTVGSTRDPDAFGPLPEHLRVRRFVPYDTLLPHTDVVLGHGGFSTTMAAIVHGVPVVIMPLGSDQPWHAEHCQRLGLGEAVAFESAGPADVASAVRRVLEDPGYRDRVAAYAGELRALPTMAEVVADLAERFAPR
jgi:UDP:flavonoid glycosyltransferase YjiC (YdhE family)